MRKEQPKLSRKEHTVFVGLTITSVLVVSLFLAEILVRLFFRYNTPDTVRENSLQYVPSILTRVALKPNQHVEIDKAWGLRSEADRTDRVYVVNEHGYRGSSFSLEKPEGVCRSVVIGGSAVFDIKAQEGRDWPHLVESLLRQRGIEGAEVINAGTPGHASSEVLARLYAQIWMLEPDFVLLYSAWNDIKYFRKLSRRQPLISLTHPYDEKSDPFRNYSGSLDRALSRSQLYVKLRTRYLLRKVNVGLEGRMPEEELVSYYDRTAVQQYRLNLELIVEASRAIGASPVLLTQASLVSAESSKEDRSRIAYEYQGLTHATLVRAFAECNDAMRSVAREKHTGLIDLAAMYSGQSELFDDHVHTTPRGSEMIAAAVAEYLAKRLDEGCGESPSR